MMQLLLLGVIVIGAAIGWVYYNKGKKRRFTETEKEEDGKVIYLFDGEDGEEGKTQKSDDSKAEENDKDNDKGTDEDQ